MTVLVNGKEVKHEVKKVGGLFCISLPEQDRTEMTNKEAKEVSGIDELERMLESRSTDYGRMRQLLAFYKLGIDKVISDLRKECGGLSKVQFVKIIENLVAGDMAKAIAYAELMIQNAERKYGETKDIFDKYDIMTAKNVLHVLKGEPKEGGRVVLD